MPLDAMANPLVLPLLGLLVEQPAHAYALTQRLAERYPQLAVRRSSVTTLIRSLAAAGVVKPQRPKRIARRPARVTFEPADAGYTHLRERISVDLVFARAGSTRFVFSLAYAGLLSRASVAVLLRRRLDRLATEHQTASREHALPEYQMLEVSYWQALVAAEIAWVQTLATRLERAAIAWPRQLHKESR